MWLGLLRECQQISELVQVAQDLVADVQEVGIFYRDVG